MKASSQCGVLMKYSSDLVGATSSIRNGMTASPRLTARSTSRLICGEALALEENTSTKTRAWPRASTIDSPQSAPGRMSRGAIQQRTPADSRMAQAASAVSLSFDE